MDNGQLFKNNLMRLMAMNEAGAETKPVPSSKEKPLARKKVKKHEHTD